MTLLDATISTWVTSSPIGAPYIGVRSWGVWQVSSQAWSALRGWSWTGSSSSATSGVMMRRRNPAELRQWAGRQKRRRRVVLTGWDIQARQRARMRGRSGLGQTAR